MATTKSTTKKTAPKSTVKATAVKKTTVKKTPAKKTAAKKPTVKKTNAKQSEMRSFRLSREERSFKEFQITRQTVYWIILIAFIIFAQLWILSLQIEVASLIESQQSQLMDY